MQFLIVLVACLAAAHAQIVFPGKCDANVKVQNNFDVARYTGLWYEIHRYEQFDQIGGDCVTANYTLQDGVVQVNNRMVLAGNVLGIRGTAVVAPNANGTGKLLVTFPSVNRTSDYWVLSTNYESYALVYVCADINNDRKRVSSWVLSRTPALKPQDVLSMNAAIDAVDGLDWAAYRETKQTEAACRVNGATTTAASVNA